ncbi:hypothetical protein COV82_02115 [Candidatus Peregrinibacteria bacterium CG11_big_fil_rev_8_21_14_0_20_46_8]|nr:MAG: hypothetical protein COV82_02115 [Candidatus Peregrinibacteria bacterium CG11_big_fil_rev_8_21_14_0_20_46_8]
MITKSRLWSIACTTLLVLGIFGANSVSAQNNLPPIRNSVRNNADAPLPANTLDAQGSIRPLQSGGFDFSSGVQLGPFTPQGSRNPANYGVLPSFAGINAPVWLSEQGPAQIADDLVVHGIVDVGSGFINSTPTVINACSGLVAASPPSGFFASGTTIETFSITVQPANFNGTVTWTHLQNGTQVGATQSGLQATFNNLNDTSVVRAQATPQAGDPCLVNFTSGNSLNFVRQTASESRQFTGSDDILFQFSAQLASAGANEQITILQLYTTNNNLSNAAEINALAQSMRLEQRPNSNAAWQQINGTFTGNPQRGADATFFSFIPNGNWPNITNTPSEYRIRGDIQCNASGLATDFSLAHPTNAGQIGILSTAAQQTYTEANTNSRTIPNCPAPPDLTIDAVITNPPTPILNQLSMVYGGRVINRGQTLPADSTTRIRIINNTTGAVVANTEQISRTGILRMNGTSTAATRWQQDAVGRYTVEICADINNDIAEADETNNCSQQQFSVITTARADLIVDTLTTNPSTAVAGTPMSFSGTVRNVGDLAINTNTTTRFRILNGTTPVVMSTTQTGNLAATTGNEVESFQWRNTVAGNYIFEICADSTNTIAESDETTASNCASRPFAVTAALPLVINRNDTNPAGKFYNNRPAAFAGQQIGAFTIAAPATNLTIQSLTFRPSANSRLTRPLRNVYLYNGNNIFGPGITRLQPVRQQSSPSDPITFQNFTVRGGNIGTFGFQLMGETECGSGTGDFILQRSDVSSSATSLSLTYPESLGTAQPCPPSNITITREAANEPNTLQAGTDINNYQTLYQFNVRSDPGDFSSRISQIDLDVLNYSNQLPLILGPSRMRIQWFDRTQNRWLTVPASFRQIFVGRPPSQTVKQRISFSSPQPIVPTQAQYRLQALLTCLPTLPNGLDFKIVRGSDVVASTSNGRAVNIILNEPDRPRTYVACPSTLTVTRQDIYDSAGIQQQLHYRRAGTRFSGGAFERVLEFIAQAANREVTITSVTVQKTQTPENTIDGDTLGRFDTRQLRLLRNGNVIAGPIPLGYNERHNPVTFNITERVRPGETANFIVEALLFCDGGLTGGYVLDYPLTQITTDANSTILVPNPFPESLKRIPACTGGIRRSPQICYDRRAYDDDCDGQSRTFPDQPAFCEVGDTTRWNPGPNTVSLERDVCRTKCEEVTNSGDCGNQRSTTGHGHCQWVNNRCQTAPGFAPSRTWSGTTESLVAAAEYGTANLLGALDDAAQYGKAQVITPPIASGAPRLPQISTPVTFFDNLQIAGGGPAQEPGQLWLQGEVNIGGQLGGTGILDIGATNQQTPQQHQLTGNLNLSNGTLTVDNMQVFGDLNLGDTVINGGITLNGTQLNPATMLPQAAPPRFGTLRNVSGRAATATTTSSGGFLGLFGGGTTTYEWATSEARCANRNEVIISCEAQSNIQTERVNPGSFTILKDLELNASGNAIGCSVNAKKNEDIRDFSVTATAVCYTP